MRPIRTLALCLFYHEGRILVEQNFDKSKQDYYCRPLGGGVEFGETSREAIVREIQEELGAEIANVQLLGVLENLFICEGQQGHEIVFVYDAQFQEEKFYAQEFLDGYEQGSDTHFMAHWRSMNQILSDGTRLVPEGLPTLIASLK